MWTCPSCAEQNLDGASSCEVCSTRVFPGEPPARARAAAAAGRAVPMPFPGSRRLHVLAAFALVSLVVTGVVVLPQLRQPADAQGSATVNAEPEAVDPTTEPPTDPLPEATTEPATPTPPATEDVAAAVGIVDVHPSLAGSDRASDVADMFNTYFKGINTKDYYAVGSVLDPAGTIDPDNARQMDGLKKGTRSTQDFAITLLALAETGDGLLTADVVFQSNQAAGAGPKGRTGETCTRWAVTYKLSVPYRIRKSTASSEPC